MEGLEDLSESDSKSDNDNDNDDDDKSESIYPPIVVPRDDAGVTVFKKMSLCLHPRILHLQLTFIAIKVLREAQLQIEDLRSDSHRLRIENSQLHASLPKWV